MRFPDKLLAIRDRWLASPRFQRWAAAFPLTRGTARTQARALFDVCAGFVYSQILFACVRLGLFEHLRHGPQTVEALATALNVPRASMQRLLDAAVSLQLVDARSAGRYGLGPLGAALLGNPGVGSMIEHHRMLYADLNDPVALLRGEHAATELGRYWAYARTGSPAGLSGGDIAAYTTLMSESNALVAAEILDAYPLADHRVLLDVGGGEGGFCVEALRRHATLGVMLFDLPPVAARARAIFSANGLDERARAVGGDFLRDPLPSGADVISLVRVVHDHDDEAAMRVLCETHRALADDGVLLLAEPMAGTPGAAPVGDAYFGFYLLAMGSGKPRTPEVLKAMLRTAGFASAQTLRTRQPLLSRVIVARKGVGTTRTVPAS